MRAIRLGGPEAQRDREGAAQGRAQDRQHAVGGVARPRRDRVEGRRRRRARSTTSRKALDDQQGPHRVAARARRGVSPRRPQEGSARRLRGRAARTWTRTIRTARRRRAARVAAARCRRVRRRRRGAARHACARQRHRTRRSTPSSARSTSRRSGSSSRSSCSRRPSSSTRRIPRSTTRSRCSRCVRARRRRRSSASIKRRRSMPNYIDARFNKASVLLDAGDYARAKTELTAIVEKRPDDYAAQVALGVAQRGLKEFDEAKKTWERVIKDAPKQQHARAPMRCGTSRLSSSTSSRTPPAARRIWSDICKKLRRATPSVRTPRTSARRSNASEVSRPQLGARAHARRWRCACSSHPHSHSRRGKADKGGRCRSADNDGRQDRQVGAKRRRRPARRRKVKNFDFNGLDLNGRMRTPQLLYFLERANEELERASLEKRSFIPHMVRSVEEEQPVSMSEDGRTPHGADLARRGDGRRRAREAGEDHDRPRAASRRSSCPTSGCRTEFAIVRPGNRGLPADARRAACAARSASMASENDVADFVARGDGEVVGGFHATPISGTRLGRHRSRRVSGDYKLFFQFVPVEDAQPFFTPQVIAAGAGGYADRDARPRRASSSRSSAIRATRCSAPTRSMKGAEALFRGAAFSAASPRARLRRVVDHEAGRRVASLARLLGRCSTQRCSSRPTSSTPATIRSCGPARATSPATIS